MLRFGVVGFGKMGMLHTSILNSLKNVELAAIVDNSKLILSSIQTLMPHVKTYKDHKNMLMNENLDFVVISTPVHTHTKIAIDCIENGCHVFLEKPAAQNLEDFYTLREASLRNSDLMIITGYCYRYRSTFKKVKEILDSGLLGKIILFNGVMYSSDIRKPERGWRFKKSESGGGVIIDSTSHVIDMLAWYLGKPHEIMARTSNWYSKEVEDYVHAVYSFNDGLTGWIESSWAVPNYRVPSMKIHLIGTKGEVIVTTDEVRLFLNEGGGAYKKGWTVQYAVDLRPPVNFEIFEEFYTLQLEEFIACITHKSDHLNSLPHTGVTQQIIETIYKSSAVNGQGITMDLEEL
ncbi:Gfo/Idh/MocA family oxidoreductase [bacterium]|nr:Gfo/Idh/MocA family oxidoreductase [bacterium]